MRAVSGSLLCFLVLFGSTWGRDRHCPSRVDVAVFSLGVEGRAAHASFS